MDSNYDKNDGRSTCLNYGPGTQSGATLNYVAEPTDQQSREAITMEVRMLLARAEAFEEELSRIDRKEGEELKKK